MTERLRRFFSDGGTAEIAKRLLGKLLIYHSPQGLMSGYITETEAYLGQADSTAHAYQGKRTPANEALYGVPGTIYIYSIHSRLCLDIATQAKDVPEGILIRGIEPHQGLDFMNQNRQRHGFELTNGPGKLMEALGISDKQMNLAEFGEVALDIDLNNEKVPQQIVRTERIGVSKQGDWAKQPLRYFVKGNPFVSKTLKRDFDLKNYGWKKL